MIWFTSDSHFRHNAICKYSERPFSSVEDMDEEILHKWNEKIKPSDTLYFLGDFVFTRNNRKEEIFRIRYRINCENIHFVLGNHDKTIRKYAGEFVKDGTFLSVQDVLEIKDTTPRIWLSHYAHKVWPRSHYSTYHLFGHSHGSLKDDNNSLSFDVGVDTNDYYPYSLEDVRHRMSTKIFQPVDHHTKETK